MEKQREIIKKESVKKRKRSFFAILVSALLFLNLMPMNTFAKAWEVLDFGSDYGQDILEIGDTIENEQTFDVEVYLQTEGNPDDNFLTIGSNNTAGMSDEIGGTDKWYIKSIKSESGGIVDGADIYMSPIMYHVLSFDANGHGTAPDPIKHYDYTYSEPSLVLEPSPAPSAEGYTFGGWYKEQACINAWTFDTQPAQGNPVMGDELTEDTTLYAKWIPDLHTVSFDSNGGSEVATQSVEYGSKAIKPDDPTKAGYIFAGWDIQTSSANDDSTTYSAYDFETPVTSDIHLVARYIFDENSHGDNRLGISDGFSDFTDEMKEAGFDTEDKVRSAMYKAVVDAVNDGAEEDRSGIIVGSRLYDVEFMISFDGGNTWEPVSEVNFPKDGLYVEIPYPEGTDKRSNDFIVAHMFTHNMRGHNAGETETIIPEETETCLKFKVSSLSPVLVTWTRAAEEAEEVSTDNTVSVNEVPNEVPATMESRAPKTGENMTFIMATVFCLMAGAGLTGYALFIRRKRNR